MECPDFQLESLKRRDCLKNLRADRMMVLKEDDKEIRYVDVN
jgi:hypothetical protein